MTSTEIIRVHKEICNQACRLELFEALKKIRTIAAETHNEETITELEDCEATYCNMLNYTIKNISDPQRDVILASLVIKIIELSDKIKEIFLVKSNNDLIQKKSLAFNALENLKLQWLNLQELRRQDKDLKELLSDSNIVTDSNSLWQSIGFFRNSLFNYILFSDKLNDADIEFIKSAFKSTDLPWYEKCVLVSSVTLSVLRYFDSKKINLLLNFYESAHIQIKQRALTGIWISFVVYNQRIKFYQPLQQKLQKIYAENSIDETDFIFLLKQLIKARDTEKISRKMKDDIIPDLQKLTPKIEEKLDLENLFNDQSIDDKNPDWENILGDSPELLGKLEELSKLQLEGNDVFMSAFSMLKHFDFFNKIPNWFLPFFADNPDLRSNSASDDSGFDNTICKTLEKSAYMCNSDKYSFLLNLKMMPLQQKSMLLNMFNAELEGMRELSESDELIDNKIKNRTIVTQYIQDLYRFFKIHKARLEFEDIFETDPDYQNNVFLKIVFPDENITHKIADFLFETDHYQEALRLFIYLKPHEKSEMEYLQKTGFCYQQNEDYENALKYYIKAELFDSENIWNLKKIAFCYKQQNKHQEAVKYYLEIEKREPENLNNVMNIGNSYLRMKEFSKALNYYYKIEFNSNENTGIYRPIAWCLFVSGQLQKSRNYFEKILGLNLANQYDLMNFGHLNMVEKNFEAAAHLYIKSLQHKNNSAEIFFKGFFDDSVYLINQNVSINDINLMSDYLKYQIR